jgi:flagellar M-ring protein FliF
MRTDTPPTTSSPVARLRAEFARARRRLAERAPGWSRGLAARWSGRWPLVLATSAVVAVVALVAFSATSSTTSPGVFLRSGYRYSRDDLASIRRALDGKHVLYRIDDGRVEIAAEKIEEANEVVAKLEVGPRSLSEIEKGALESNLLDTPGVKEQRAQQARNNELALLIGRIDGIVGAQVWVNRPPRRLGQRTPPGATALVYLETQDDREINPSTVQNIVGLVSKFDPEVRQDAVSIYDRKLQPYSLAHDPAAGAQTRARAHAEELRREIASKLDWIKGVQVSVRLVATAPVPAPVAVPTGPTVPLATLPPLPPEPPPPLPAEELRLAVPPPSVAANQPIELNPEGEAVRSAPPGATGGLPTSVAGARDTGGQATSATPGESKLIVAGQASPAPGATGGQATSATPAPVAIPEPPSQAQVWVRVPRSYYLRAPSRREPSLDDLQPLVTRTEREINKAVRHVVPPGLLGEVSVSTIPDDPPSPAPALAAADARHASSSWVLGGVGVGAGIALSAVLAWLAAARRPVPRPSARSDRGRYKIDEAPDVGAGPGPTERVRELIRLNPEAAASVLHRWTGQGGPGA